MKTLVLSNSSSSLDENYITQCQTWDDFVTLGMNFRELKDQSQWLLGKLALAVEIKYGEENLDKFAKEIGIVRKTLEVYRWVVKKYYEDDPQFVPVPKLAFALYQAAAGLPKKEREALLYEADIGSYSVERLRVTLLKRENKKIKPKFKVEFCELHQKWYFVPQDLNEWEPYHE